jgi:cytochrome P450
MTDRDTLVASIRSLSWKGNVAFCLFIGFVAAILSRYLRWRMSPLNKIPGPKYSFFVGAFRDIQLEPFMEPLKRWCQELSYENLPLLHYSSVLGAHSVVVLDKEIVRTILAAQFLTIKPEVPKRPRFHRGQVGFLRTVLGDGLITLEGEDWRRHRRMLQPSFRTDFLKDSLNEEVPPQVERFVSYWKMSLANRGANDTSPREIDISSHLSALTLDVVGKVLFSHEFNGIESIAEWATRTMQENDPDADSKVAQLEDPFLRALNDSLKPSLITFFLFAFGLSFMEENVNPRTRKTRAALNMAADQVITRALDAGSRSTMRSKSLLHLMLVAEDPEHDDQGRATKRLTREELRDETKTFLMAGRSSRSRLPDEF